jgi:hypothetical protein
MSGPKDYSLDGKDRAEWDRAWRAMPHRRLLSPPRLNLDDRFGTLLSTTISQDPAEFSDFGFRESETCPICGVSTVDGERFAATLHPTWESGLGVGIGVWVHRTCFEACPLTDQPTPVPW